MKSTAESSPVSKHSLASRRRPARGSPRPRKASKLPGPTDCLNYFRTAQAEEVARQIPNYDPWKLAGDCHFDVEAAADAVDFWHYCLTFVKGERSGASFQLERWQQAIVGNTFGWKRPDGRRRFTRVFIAVPRKGGKTPLAAGFGLRIWAGEIEPGAEVISVASTREQARKVWEWAGGMIRKCPRLSQLIRIYQHSMVLNDDPLASYKPVAAEAGARHGDDLHGAVVDELHTLPSRELIDVIETSTAARRQPLIVFITTAGWDRNSICYEKWKYGKSVQDGMIADSAFLPVIYETEHDDDWTSEAVWRKANPNLGISVKLDYLRAECEKAKQSPAYENTFRQLHLNQWTEQEVRYFPMEFWDKCGPRRPLESLKGELCYAGLDLALKKDLAGLTLVFPDDDGFLDVFCWAWIPEETAREHEKTDRVPYREWARQGLIELTPGDAIDHRYIAERIVLLCGEHDMDELAFDPHGATQLIAWGGLSDRHGIECIEIPQTWNHLSEPMNLVLTALRTGKLRHGNNPLLRWQFSNTAAQPSKFDPDSVRPFKAHKTGRIDNVVALIMALSRVIKREASDSFIYDRRPVRRL